MDPLATRVIPVGHDAQLAVFRQDGMSNSDQSVHQLLTKAAYLQLDRLTPAAVDERRRPRPAIDQRAGLDRECADTSPRRQCGCIG